MVEMWSFCDGMGDMVMKDAGYEYCYCYCFGIKWVGDLCLVGSYGVVWIWQQYKWVLGSVMVC